MWWISKKQKAVALICVGSLFKLSGIIKQDKFTRILILQYPTVTHRCRVSGTIWNCIIHTLPLRPTITKHLIFPAFRHFLFIWKRKRLQKKSNLRAAPRDPANATPQYLACESPLVARHIRTQTRRSLNECALVRLASQAVPSPVSIGLSNTAVRLWKTWL